MSEPIYISRIEIENIAGIDSIVLEPKPLTVIRGRNGAGKSSIEKAFRRFFKGGFDPTIVRKGTDKGTIRMTFSDDSYGYRIIDRKRKKSEIHMFSATGEEMRPPQEMVEEYASGFGFDPMAFLAAAKKDRLEYLEQFLNVKVEAQELLDACRESDFLRLFNPKDSAFANIDRIYESAYQQRTKINGEAEDLRGSVNVMRGGIDILNQKGVDWSKAEADARKQLEDLQQSHAAMIAQIATEAKASKDRATASFKEAEREIEAEYLAALRAAEARKQTRMAEAAQQKAEAERAIAEAEVKASADVEATLGASVQEARLAHAAARQKLQVYNEATGVRKQIDKFEDQIKEKAGRVLFLTNVLTRLKELRAEKQKSNPIPGLEIRTIEVRDKQEAEIFYGDVEFDALNTGKKMELCIRLAILGTGKCPLLIVGDAVNIDETNWRAFVQAARGSGLQIVAARLDDGDLRIETYDDEEIAA